MGRHDIACDVLTTASELYPKAWEVWRDLSILSTHCKNLDKMILSFHKLLDLKKSYTNIDLLIKLAFQFQLTSTPCIVSSNLRKNALDLFTRLVKRDSQNPVLWALFGLVMASDKNISDEEISVSVDCLEKSIAYITQDRQWFKKFSVAQEVLCASQIIAEVFLSCCLIFRQRNESDYLLKIIVTFLKTVIQKVNEEHIDIIEGLLKTGYRHGIEKLNDKLQCLEQMKLSGKLIC